MPSMRKRWSFALAFALTSMFGLALSVGASRAAIAEDAPPFHGPVTQPAPPPGALEPLDPIAPEVFRARRERLAALLPEALLPAIFASGERSKGEHDVRFRVSSDFYYLTGVDVHRAEVIVWRTAEGALADVLLLPRQTSQDRRWESPFLHAEDPRARTLGFDFVGRSSPEVRARTLTDLAPPFEGATALVRQLRLVKDAHEVARIQRAIDITGRAIVEAMRSCEPGHDERDLDALLRYVFRREGGDGAAFPSIVASGPNGCILHYNTNRRGMAAGDLVLLDVGAEVDRYAADVSRTFPVSGRFTPRQRQLYQAVLDAQEAGIQAVRPGATMADVHQAARAVLARRGLERYYFHSTSHWLGLDVHDPCPSSAPFAPGMVLTVEPGVYIDAEAIGIRIEDDVLVTEGGCRVLSGWIPRDPEAIEALMRERGLGNAPLAPFPPAEPAAPAPTPRKEAF